VRDPKKIKQMYETIKRNTFRKEDNHIYARMERDAMNLDKFGLTLTQTEILYNVDYYKTRNDIQHTKLPINNDGIKHQKWEWLKEWKSYMTSGFSDFIGKEDAELHWYSKEQLLQQIEENDPSGTWFRLVLLEAMIFEPYYPLCTEIDKKGKEVPSRKYQDIQNMITGYAKKEGDLFLDQLFHVFVDKGYYAKDEEKYQSYVSKRLRKCYDKAIGELTQTAQAIIKGLLAMMVAAVVIIVAAGVFAPEIAVLLVGSEFAGLHGAALISACLAYLGGGAIAVGGAGMAGGIATIVGGGAILGIGVGAGAGGIVGMAEYLGKKDIILSSVKLITAMKVIFLNDELDVAYSTSVCECYAQQILELEKDLTKKRLQMKEATGAEKKDLQTKIKNVEESLEAMKIAKDNMMKFNSAFEIGMSQQ
jgi:hypothetical protein